MARTSEEALSTLKMNPGPHIGRIVNNVDPQRQGAVQVELLGSIGDQRGMDQQLFTVRYASPSFGSTDVEHDATNAPDHHGSQQSHGFWSPPPNTGTMVMCFFINGDPGQGYYMACIQDQHMNQSVPGIASTKSTKKQFKSYNPETGDWSKITDTSKLTDQGSQLPVGEVNRPSAKGMQPNTGKMEKPVNSAKVSQLAEQGLIDDPYRGTHTSSARRESPSNVHGWGTPGALDKTPGAPTRSVGPRDTQATKHTARRPGHSFIMDDGDETQLRKSKAGEGPAEYANLQAGEKGGDVGIPKDQQIRITAANGAQFIMHSSEDFIHIHNSKGTAWVEMSSNGKIDIYTADCVSVHTEADYNITADRDVNIHAGRAINLYADHDININSKSEMHVKSHTNIQMSADNHVAVQAEGGSLMLMSNNVASMVSGEINIDAKSLDILSNTHIHMTSKGDTNFKSAQLYIGSESDIDIIAAGAIKQTSAVAHLKTYSQMVLHSDDTIDQRAEGNFSTSGADMAQTSDGPIAITAVGGDMKLQGGSNIYQNSGPGRLKGSSLALAPDSMMIILANSPNPPISAAEAAEPHEATPHKPHPTKTNADTIAPVYHSNYGRAVTSRVPGPQPYDGHEHLNPAGHTQDLTDRHNSDQPYNKGEEKRQISHPDDLENIPNGTRKQGPNVSGNRRNPYPHHPSPKSSPSSNVTSAEAQISNRNTPTDWVQDQEFMGDVAKLSGKLGITVSELLAIFAAETGTAALDPSKVNGEGCVGLVQICKSTNPKTGKSNYDELAARSPKEAAEDNLSPEGLRKLTRHRQMFWIDKYFDLILPSGAGIFPKKDRVCYVWMALAAGTDSSKLITKNVIYPFSDSRCKRNKGWQDSTHDNDCTVAKACTWLRWYEKQFVTPKLGAKSFSPDLKSGPGSTIQPKIPSLPKLPSIPNIVKTLAKVPGLSSINGSMSASENLSNPNIPSVLIADEGATSFAPSTPPTLNAESNWTGKSDERTMPSDNPGVPCESRWSWYNDKYIAVDATGHPIDASCNQVEPDVAYSKPAEINQPDPPTPSTGGLPATEMAGGNPDGSDILLP